MQEDESHFVPVVNETTSYAMNEKAPHWPIELILQRSRKATTRKGKSSRDPKASKQRQPSPTSAGIRISKPLKSARSTPSPSRVAEKKRKEAVDSEKCRFECIFGQYGCTRVFRCKNKHAASRAGAVPVRHRRLLEEFASHREWGERAHLQPKRPFHIASQTPS